MNARHHLPQWPRGVITDHGMVAQVDGVVGQLTGALVDIVMPDN